MYQYVLYNSLVTSDLEFPQLLPYDGSYEPTDLAIEIRETTISEDHDKNAPEGYYISEQKSYLSNLSCRLLAIDGTTLFYEKKGTPKNTLLQAYLLGFGMAFLFHQRKKLPIHCSCVANENGAVLLSGHSGTGKSTLTTILLEHGYHLVADDLAMVDVSSENAMVAPAFPFQKLCRNVVEEKKLAMEELIYIDEDKDKFLVPMKDTFHPAPVPLKAVIMLTVTDKETVYAEELSSIYKFHACMDTLFIGPFFGQELYKPELGKLGLSLSSKVRVFHLSRPYGKDSLQDMSNALSYYIYQINNV